MTTETPIDTTGTMPAAAPDPALAEQGGTQVDVRRIDVAEPYVESWRSFAAVEGAGVPAAVQSMRAAAIERFRVLGFPTTKIEDWHFTSVAPIAEHDWVLTPEASGDVHADALAPFLFGRGAATGSGPAWPTAVFVNGRFAPELSALDGLPDGVRVLDLQRAWRESPELADAIGTVTSMDDRAFTALNTAFMHDGAVVRIEKETEVERPIHLLFVTDANAAKAMLHPRSLITLGRNAKATVIESYVSLSDAAYLTNAVTEVTLAEGATLQHLKVQREGMRAFHVGTIEAHQARDSHYQSFSFATGGRLSRTNVYTTLDGEGSGATLNGLYMLDGDQHCDHQTMIVHAQPNCFSREIYKGILDGRSHGVFNGKVYVFPVAQKTDGKQTNNTLLLSERAQMDTKPQLEIFADDVKCTHGATVGRLDQTALFYMKSRGVGNELARRLLTYAFAADVLETIGIAEVKDQLESYTLERFTKTEA